MSSATYLVLLLSGLGFPFVACDHQFRIRALHSVRVGVSEGASNTASADIVRAWTTKERW